MATITLQFSRQKALSSHVISWFSHGRFSHVDAVLPDGTLLGARGDRVYHCEYSNCNVPPIPSGVQCRPEDYAAFDEKVRFSLRCSDTQMSAWQQFMSEQLGKPYDNLALWSFAIGRNWREDDSWICSELQARALEVAGVIYPVYGGVNKITPVDLCSIVSAMGAAQW